MNWLDGAILVIVFLAARRGFRAGLGRGGLELLGAGAGILLAYHFYDDAAVALSRGMGLPLWLTRPGAFGGLALGTAVLCHGCGLAWGRWVVDAGHVAWDRWAGAALGGLMGLLFSAVALVAWVEWPAGAFPRPVDGSFMADWLLGAVPALYSLLDEVLGPWSG